MINIESINYSNFFNNSITAFQILFNKNLQTHSLNEYRRLITEKLSININNLAIPEQIHSANVKWINSPGYFKNLDGLITGNKQIILSLQTADCIPIFLYDYILILLCSCILVFLYSYIHVFLCLYLLIFLSTCFSSS